MFNSKHSVSLVTAVLPDAAVELVVQDLVENKNASLMLSRARGTLVRDDWWKSWLPSISPSKTILRTIVPTSEVDQIESSIVVNARLHQQALGAVFSVPCDSAYIGSDFRAADCSGRQREAGSGVLSEMLSAIFCIVDHQSSDRVARAAIRAGAHGPVVQFAEGRGLRDRLGWLRITKDAEQEVLMLIADEADRENIFDAMAKAGEFHLPGRGLMYCMPVDRGMFNLPSRMASHHYAASTQQIINAIDHLTGHTHWRDQSIFEVGKEGKGVGLELLREFSCELGEQVCFSAIVDRDKSQDFIYLMLDAGAPGMNINYAKLIQQDSGDHKLAHASINREYAAMHCILGSDVAAQVARSIENDAETVGITDLCVLTHPVTRVAKYVPGATDYRRKSKLSA